MNHTQANIRIISEQIYKRHKKTVSTLWWALGLQREREKENVDVAAQKHKEKRATFGFISWSEVAVTCL